MHGKSQTVAVIGGTGAEGSAIALRLAHAGHRAIIGTRDPAKGAKIAGELNQLLGTSALEWRDNKGAAEAADIVVLTVPYSAQVAMVVRDPRRAARQDPGRCHGPAGAAEGEPGATAGRRFGGGNGPGKAGRHGAGGVGISERVRRQAPTIGSRGRLRRPGLRGRRRSTPDRNRSCCRHRIARDRRRAGVQFRGGGSADLDPHLHQSEVQGSGLGDSHYRDG